MSLQINYFGATLPDRHKAIVSCREDFLMAGGRGFPGPNGY